MEYDSIKLMKVNGLRASRKDDNLVKQTLYCFLLHLITNTYNMNTIDAYMKLSRQAIPKSTLTYNC